SEASPFAEGRSIGEPEREWGAAPAPTVRSRGPGRSVEKAPEPTKGLRMKSVASAPKGQGVITLAGRRGRGPHRINTAVERRKASWSSLRPARALSQEHASIPLRL